MELAQINRNKRTFVSVGKIVMLFLSIAVLRSGSVLGAFVLCLWAGYFKSVMDTLQFHFEKSDFADKKNQNFWNPLLGSKNKYKADGVTPKFFGSTTFLVWITDAWHLFQMFMHLALFGAIAWMGLKGNVINWWVDPIIGLTLMNCNFELYYGYLFKIK
jgi:hypothetical protein